MKKRIFALGIFIGLICCNFFISNVLADTTATISISIYRIQKIDEIENAWLLQGEADWFYHVGVSEDGGNTFQWQHSDEPIQDDTDDLIVNDIHTFTGVTSITVTIAIMLCEDDYGSSDIADVSSDSYGGSDGVADSIQPPATGYYTATYIGLYNLKTNILSGDTTYVEEGYYKTSGDYDGSVATDENDATVWFDISNNYDSPIAEAGDNQNVKTGENVNFDGGLSTASDGSSITDYKWDVDGDSIWDYQTQIASHVYSTKGTYTAILQITDSLGVTDTDTCIITVTSIPPTAAFVYSPSDYPHPTTLDTIQFTDTSTDSDGTLASWYWDFGDGTTSAERNPTHKFESGGTKYVSLTVTDNDGESDIETKTITVIELASVNGIVKDSDGNTVSGVKIELCTAGTTTVLKTVTTNTNGEYTISGIVTGTYDIEASISGYDSNKKTYKTIYAGENIVDFVLTASTSNGGEGTPGFELILVVCAIAFILLFRRYRLN